MAVTGTTPRELELFTKSNGKRSTIDPSSSRQIQVANMADLNGLGSPSLTPHSTSTPNYTPFKLASFEGLTLGAPATGATGFATAQGRTTVSNAIAGPLGGSRVMRTGFAVAGDKYFGGDVWNGSMAVPNGTILRMRAYEYFAAPWDFGYLYAADGSGLEGHDGWGYTKWLRMWFSDGADACIQTSSAGKMAGMTTEGGGFVGSQNLFFNPASVPALNTGVWICREYAIYLHATAGYIDYWQDDAYVGRLTGATRPVGSATLTRILTGDYWNGSAKQQQYFYQDELIFTTGIPDAFDSGGRAIIGKNRKVADFA